MTVHINFFFHFILTKIPISISFQTEVDELTSGVLVREDNPLGEDITQSTECKLHIKYFHLIN